MKTVVFSVAYWGEDRPKRFIPWLKCINKYINYDDIFVSCGSYSNPSKMYDLTQYGLSPIEIIQLGIKNTKPYSKNWCYFYVGFMSAIYHSLLTKDFDVLIHVQNRTFLGMDLNPVIEEFKKRKEILASPKFSSQIGTSIETGLMLMKREAVESYATSNLRCALSDYEQMNVEEEAFKMFGNSWWNFLPEFPTTRKRDATYDYDETPFNLPDEMFYELPIISGPPHCSVEQFDKWMKIKNEDIIDR
jgi:hypothetical protein